MVTGDLRKLYRDAWNTLFSVVKMRNDLLRRLDMMAAPAMSMTLATGAIYEFDADMARELVSQIEELRPRINALMQEVNKYAELIGSPRIRWQASPTAWGT